MATLNSAPRTSSLRQAARPPTASPAPLGSHRRSAPSPQHTAPSTRAASPQHTDKLEAVAGELAKTRAENETLQSALFEAMQALDQVPCAAALLLRAQCTVVLPYRAAAVCSVYCSATLL